MHHPYLMIRKYCRSSRQLHLRHVATGAVLIRHRTGLLRHAMTRQTSPVVTSVVANQIHVRIVASRAAYALVVAQEALTIGQAVRLKPDIFLAKHTQTDHGFPRAMTLAAKN